jgi:hypothetical protein
MAAWIRRCLVEGIVFAANACSLVLLRGETPDLGILDRTMAALLCVVLPLGASFLEQLQVDGRLWWSGVHLPRRRQGGVVRRGFGVGRSVMDSHRVEAWSGVMVALTTDLARVMLISVLKMDQRIDGDDDFRSEGMRRSPWVC